jgi:hypothetical protein
MKTPRFQINIVMAAAIGTNVRRQLRAIGLGLVVLVSASQVAAEEPVFVYGPSDADSIAVESGFHYNMNFFWWNHPNLTVAVRSAPNVDAAKLQAVRDAIGVWNTILAVQLPEISLTEVTDSAQSNPDIILHYVPHAGGVVWGGITIGAAQHSPNVMVRSDEPPGGPYADFDALRVERTTLHEIGHALGIGHAAPLDRSRDIMGYGWSNASPDLVPIISDCDLDAIRATFSWLFANEPPHPSPITEGTCLP